MKVSENTVAIYLSFEFSIGFMSRQHQGDKEGKRQRTVLKIFTKFLHESTPNLIDWILQEIGEGGGGGGSKG